MFHSQNSISSKNPPTRRRRLICIPTAPWFCDFNNVCAAHTCVTHRRKKKPHKNPVQHLSGLRAGKLCAIISESWRPGPGWSNFPFEGTHSDAVGPTKHLPRGDCLSGWPSPSACWILDKTSPEKPWSLSTCRYFALPFLRYDGKYFPPDWIL